MRKGRAGVLEVWKVVINVSRNAILVNQGLRHVLESSLDDPRSFQVIAVSSEDHRSGNLRGQIGLNTFE